MIEDSKIPITNNILLKLESSHYPTPFNRSPSNNLNMTKMLNTLNKTIRRQMVVASMIIKIKIIIKIMKRTIHPHIMEQY